MSTVTRRINKNAIIFFLAILCLGNLFSTIYYYNKYTETKKFIGDPAAFSQNEAKILKEKVGKLIDLPTDEEPTIVTVTDIEKVKSQPFFAKASNGDKVLIYQNNKKAILYNPTRNQVLEVGPLLTPNTTSTPGASLSATLKPSAAPPSITATPTPEKTNAKVIIINGTESSGLTGKVEKAIHEKFPDIDIVSLGVAVKKDYEKTLVVNLNGAYKNTVEELSKSIGAEVSDLPSDEKKPVKTDILIIVGKDKMD
jgi:hypothetical protein